MISVSFYQVSSIIILLRLIFKHGGYVWSYIFLPEYTICWEWGLGKKIIIVFLHANTHRNTILITSLSWHAFVFAVCFVVHFCGLYNEVRDLQWLFPGSDLTLCIFAKRASSFKETNEFCQSAIEKTLLWVIDKLYKPVKCMWFDLTLEKQN